MKHEYVEPQLSFLVVSSDDILTLSAGDNDALFVPPTFSQDDGWSGYH